MKAQDQVPGLPLMPYSQPASDIPVGVFRSDRTGMGLALVSFQALFSDVTEGHTQLLAQNLHL